MAEVTFNETTLLFAISQGWKLTGGSGSVLFHRPDGTTCGQSVAETEIPQWYAEQQSRVTAGDALREAVQSPTVTEWLALDGPSLADSFAPAHDDTQAEAWWRRAAWSLAQQLADLKNAEKGEPEEETVQRCRASQTGVDKFCSRPPGHLGDHIARFGHEEAGALMECWPQDAWIEEAAARAWDEHKRQFPRFSEWIGTEPLASIIRDCYRNRGAK